MTRLTAFRVALGLTLIGLVAGTILDPRPERTQPLVDGYRVIEADFHVHTRFSDGFLSPFHVVIQAQRRGLDAIAITEHNMIFPAQLARWFSAQIGGPTVIIGEEVTTGQFHLIGIGLSERVDWNQPVGDVITAIERQGGVAIAAHPVRKYWPVYEPVLDRLHAAEVMHPIAYQGERSSEWSWSNMRDFYQHSAANGHRLAAIGSSDYHFFSPLGVCRTLVLAENDTAEAIVAAVAAGRTAVYDLNGQAYGDEVAIAALRASDYQPAAQDYNYAGAGVLDRVTRTAGWLGLIGLLAFCPFAPRRREAA